MVEEYFFFVELLWEKLKQFARIFEFAGKTSLFILDEVSNRL